jgi:hypothetical protein
MQTNPDPRSIKRRQATGWAIAIFVIVMAILTLLALNFRQYFHEVLVNPLLLFFGQLRDLINSLHQWTIWIFWLVVLLVWLIFSLLRLRNTPAGPEYVEISPAVDNRLQYWNNQVRLLTQGTSSSPFAIKILRQMVLNVVDFERRFDDQTSLDDLPPHILKALQFESKSNSPKNPWLVWLAETTGLPFLTKRYLAPDATRMRMLDEILTYLEEQLEI